MVALISYFANFKDILLLEAQIQFLYYVCESETWHSQCISYPQSIHLLPHEHDFRAYSSGITPTPLLVSL